MYIRPDIKFSVRFSTKLGYPANLISSLFLIPTYTMFKNYYPFLISKLLSKKGQDFVYTQYYVSDRNVESGKGDKVAFYWVGNDPADSGEVEIILWWNMQGYILEK